MSKQLTISAGQFSCKGRKDVNQDFHGIYHASGAQLGHKGIAIALADGISGSDVSQVASQFAVTGFLDDYYCTSDAWSVKTAAERVLAATNSWLYAQTQQGRGRYDKDQGYVCTLSTMVIKSATAHIFHVGDTRIYRLHGATLEQLTVDHRIQVSPQQSYLSRALGVDSQLDIDYRTVPVEAGDLFVLATDGVYEYVDGAAIAAAITATPQQLDLAAQAIVEEAYRRGSPDNLTVQLVRIDALPSPEVNELVRRYAMLPFPPLLEPGQMFDGYKIVRELHGSSRSHIYLAHDPDSGQHLVIKAPAIDLQNDPAYIERFLMEEWVARRIHSPHVLKPVVLGRTRNFLYVLTEFIEGQTLAQWLQDHPRPGLPMVRGIVGQVAKGLRALHRLDMVHQDLRPENIMIDGAGMVTIIDLGAASVAGISEFCGPAEQAGLPGALQCTAPEYFLGEDGSARSDIYALGVLVYQILTGTLPYGVEVPKARTRAAQRKLRYDPAPERNRDVPPWVDEAIKKAVHPDPLRRYDDVAEFLYDLEQPNRAFLGRQRLPLIERHPLAFWKGMSFVLASALLLSLAFRGH
ncbi:bifunctional protein-serine/threonine kinase/phosphatase [Duganella sp. FT3S]|uniref:Bifunctional protein-serine/threonine kinase/phosphatase n=1 Tax=Rugamonas fusca TaxID=2758568 RepID=A0A7W2I6X7_9BURK|nr:bifunctional protein-serine/threonine kinase/phosphatase [Rugamonas fusca]MBA5605869.1 bifunctional protein-serine/threonine kinase/phosphatase [Rugamonas fusca]